MMVSIIIPTYNRATFIERAVKSVISQTYQNFEIIIVDDCSQDNTDFVIEKLKTKYLQYQIKYFKNGENKGAQYTRNKGIKNAKGEWIAFLDSDDEFLPDRIEKALIKAKEKNVQVVHCECFVDFGNNEPLVKRGVRRLSGNIYHDLLKNAGPVFPGLFVNKSCFEKINYLDENIVSHQEWETSIRLAKYFEFGFIDEPLFIWHQDGHDAISRDIEKSILGYKQIINKHKNEILKKLGKGALREHYSNLAYRYYDSGNFYDASKYFKKTANISQFGFNKILRSFQSNRFVLKYLPIKYFDLLLIIKKFKSIL